MKTRSAALQVSVEGLGRVYLEALPWGNESGESGSPPERATRGSEAGEAPSPARLPLRRRLVAWLRSLVPSRGGDQVLS